jgi:chemotaxis protein methyltransferase CheR
MDKNMLSKMESGLNHHNELNARLENDEIGYGKVEAILRDETGIKMPMNDKNKALMASRLISVLKAHGLKNYREYAQVLKRGNPADLKELVECLTTNKTEFYREPKHFDLLIRELPRLLEENKAAGRRELRIWCAAASTGQEPYTIAITVTESIANLAAWNVKFLASDIDTQVLEKAATGNYIPREYDGLTAARKSRFFSPKGSAPNTSLQVNADLRKMITFAPFNLMTDPFPFEHPFDVIFCRNVLIYFERETSTAVVSRLSSALRPGGILFLGHTESGIPKPAYMGTLDVAAYISKRTF